MIVTYICADYRSQIVKIGKSSAVIDTHSFLLFMLGFRREIHAASMVFLTVIFASYDKIVHLILYIKLNVCLSVCLLRQSSGAGGHRKNSLLISRTPLADFLQSNQDFSEDRLLNSRFLRDSAIYLQKIRAKKIQQAVSQKSADSASGLPKSPDCFAKNPRAGCEKSAIYFSGARLPPAIV